MGRKREKTFAQQMAEGKALIKQDAKRQREEMVRSQFDLDMYTRRDLVNKNPWGM